MWLASCCEASASRRCIQRSLFILSSVVLGVLVCDCAGADLCQASQAHQRPAQEPAGGEVERTPGAPKGARHVLSTPASCAPRGSSRSGLDRATGPAARSTGSIQELGSACCEGGRPGTMSCSGGRLCFRVCSASSASLVHVRDMSLSVACTRGFGAPSANFSHSAARSLQSSEFNTWIPPHHQKSCRARGRAEGFHRLIRSASIIPS